MVSQPDDPNVIYAGEYLGIITRYDHRTRQPRNIAAYPENGSGHGAEDLTYRFQWTAPIVTSPHDPKAVYHGGNVLFRSTDAGQTWAAISPDLTRNDKSKQKWAGGPITGDNTGVEFYGTIFAVAESPREAGLIWLRQFAEDARDVATINLIHEQEILLALVLAGVSADSFEDTVS